MGIHDVITLKEKEEIVKQLKEFKLTVEEIAEIFDRNPASIYNIANEFNLPTKSARLNKSEVENIVSLIKECRYTQTELSRKTGKSRTAIRKIIRDYGLENCFEKKDRSWENFFDNLSPIAAYVLGFIVADGYVNETDWVLELTLSTKDHDFLEKIKLLVGHKDLKIIDSKRYRDRARANFCSKHMVERLVELGVPQAKTFIAKTPELIYQDRELMRHFIRGLFDGDGCAWVAQRDDNYYHQHLVIEFSGTESIMNDIYDYFSEITPAFEGSLSQKENIWVLKYYNKTAILICDCMYKDTDDSNRMTRKYDIYKEFK